MTTTRERPPVERLVYTVPEAAEALGVHANTIWNWIRKGNVNVTRVERTTRIPAHELQRLIQNADQSVSK